MEGFVGLHEAAKRIGITPGALKWHLLYGGVGDVTLRAPNGSRLFTEGDIQRLQGALAKYSTRIRADESRTVNQVGSGEGIRHER